MRCKCRSGSIRQTPKWERVGDLGDVYTIAGLTIGGETDGVKKIIPLANSGAMIVIAEAPGEKPRLPGESQVAPFTLKELKEVAPH